MGIKREGMRVTERCYKACSDNFALRLVNLATNKKPTNDNLSVFRADETHEGMDHVSSPPFSRLKSFLRRLVGLRQSVANSQSENLQKCKNIQLLRQQPMMRLHFHRAKVTASSCIMRTWAGIIYNFDKQLSLSQRQEILFLDQPWHRRPACSPTKLLISKIWLARNKPLVSQPEEKLHENSSQLRQRERALQLPEAWRNLIVTGQEPSLCEKSAVTRSRPSCWSESCLSSV